LHLEAFFMRSTLRSPSLRRHKPSSLGVVTLNDKDHYFGQWPDDRKHPPEEVEAAYDRLIAEWLAAGRRLQPVAPEQPGGISVGELILAFWHNAEQHYSHEDGTPTGELVNLRYSFRHLRELYATLPAAEFSPLKLKTVRQRMIDAGLCRTLIHKRIGHIVRMYRWAVAEEIVAETVHRAIAAVQGLQQGRTEAHETDAVKPVAVEIVEAALPYMLRQVRAMVELQLHTGMRPGEVMAMRAIDLNTTGSIWVYSPRHHKNRHRGTDRIIHLGPKSQEIVRPFLRPNHRGVPVLATGRRGGNAIQALGGCFLSLQLFRQCPVGQLPPYLAPHSPSRCRRFPRSGQGDVRTRRRIPPDTRVSCQLDLHRRVQYGAIAPRNQAHQSGDEVNFREGDASIHENRLLILFHALLGVKPNGFGRGRPSPI
jgi:integrase